MKSTACSLLFWLLAFSCSFRTEQISGGPESSWSVRMADAVIERFDSLIHYNNPSKVKWQYDIAMLGQAVDKLGYLDIEYSEYLRDYLDYFIGEDGTIKIYKQEDFNLDHINPAKNLLTLYKRTGQDKYYLAIKTFVSHLENQPRTESGGFWHKKIYPWQMWLDGIYMSSPFLAQYSQEFNQSAWFDTVAEQITLIYSRTVDEQTGLLYHAWDESRQQKWANPETGCSPNFWGRAMGW
ncbi:MAG: glycoside hydrolase family 88 protein, partial [Bacteroidales bacterium]